MISFIMLQIELLADSISKYGLYTMLVAGAGLLMHKMLTYMFSILSRYEEKLDSHDKFKEETVKEIIVLLKENHNIMRERHEIDKEVMKILYIISSKNSGAL